MRCTFRPIRLISQVAVLGAGATVIALGIIVPVLATTEKGPLLVTVTTSPNPYAIEGSTSVDKSMGVYGYSASSTAENVTGVMGYVRSGGVGVEGYNIGEAGLGVEGYATGNGGYGVSGYSATDLGIFGESSMATGILGLTLGKTSGGLAGVAGNDLSTVNGNAGVAGESYNGSGVYGDNVTDGSTPAPNIDTDVGVYGTSTYGTGVYGYSGDRNAIVAESDSPVYNALYAQADNATGTAFRAYNTSTKANMAFDYHGNLTITGNVIANGTTLSARLRNPNSDLMTYASQSTESTVEDVGSAQLVNGTATVALASDFRQTIDGSSAYMVFLTPYGDNRGLYIAERGPAWFVVRESSGGHSTLAFDYRIVARPYGTRDARLPHYAAMIKPSISEGTRSSRKPAFRPISVTPPAPPHIPSPY